MAIRVIHSPGFEQLGALALAAGRSRSQSRSGGFSDTQRAITARDIALIRERAQVAAARERNFGRAVPSGKIESPEAKRRREQGEIGQMILTRQAQRVGSDLALNDREKRIALAQLDRRQKLLKRQEPSAQETFEKSIVTDRDTGRKYFRNKTGEYKPLEDGKNNGAVDFSKAVSEAKKNLIAQEEERVAIAGGTPNLDIPADRILGEAQRIIDEQNEAVALAETLQELMKTSEGRLVQISGLEGRRSAPGRGVISSVDDSGKRTSSTFPKPSKQSVVSSKSVAEEEDPLALPSKVPDIDEGDTVIDLNKLKPEEVIKQFQEMKPEERREFLGQLGEDELKIFREHLPKAQRSAIRRAEKRLEKELRRQRPSKTRIREAEKSLARVLFEWGTQPKRDPIPTPLLGGF